MLFNSFGIGPILAPIGLVTFTTEIPSWIFRLEQSEQFSIFSPSWNRMRECWNNKKDRERFTEYVAGSSMRCPS